MEEMLARRVAADVAAQERRDVLQDALALILERRRADVADRSEQPRSEAERIGVLGAHADVRLRVGGRVAREPVEIDLARLGAGSLAKQNVAALNEAQAEPVVRPLTAALVLRVE